MTSVSWRCESSIFAFSAASVSRCKRLAIAAQVDALILLELVREPVDDAAVVVVATEVGVTVGGLHLEDAFAHLEDRDVERPTTEVEDEDLLVLLLLEAVRERGRGGLVDDAQDVEARDLAGVLGRLALSVVEVRGNGDHRVGDLLAEIRLGVGLELLQDHRGDLLGVKCSPLISTSARPSLPATTL